MISIWEPLTKITVVESNSAVARAGSTGFVVILADDNYGYRNYWTVDLILTRNGKKGQRSLQYRRVKTKKLEYSDLYKPAVVEQISTAMFEPSENKRFDSVVLAREPYKSKDLLEVDVWDFLGWISACSQLLAFLNTGKDLLKRITNGLPPSNKPYVEPFVPSDGTDLLSIDPERLINVLYFFLPDKKIKESLIKAFNDKAVRIILIEKCLRTISCGKSIYTEMKKQINNIYQQWLSDLSQSVTAHLNSENQIKKDMPIKEKATWRLKKPPILYKSTIMRRSAPEPRIIQENIETYDNFHIVTDASPSGTNSGESAIINNNTSTLEETINPISPPPSPPTPAEAAGHFFSHPVSQQTNVAPAPHINNHVAAEAEDYLNDLLSDSIDEPTGGSNADNS